MTVTQHDLDSFHDFATQMLAHRREALSFEELFEQWCAKREREETIAAVREGIADAEAGRTVDIKDADAMIRTRLGFPPRR